MASEFIPNIKTQSDIKNYYLSSPDYLNGPLSGTCHFGFTKLGEDFDLRRALLSMEFLLADKLNLPQNSMVFDGGMGFGRVASTLANEFGLNIYGIDLMRERLSEADRYINEKGLANRITLIEGNYCNIPLPDASVDAVYTMETLVHAYPLESALSEFRRILKPGGKLVNFEYSIPSWDSLDPFSKAVASIMIKKTAMPSIKRFHHWAFPPLLRVAGFRNVEVSDISKNVWPTWEWMFNRAADKIKTGKPIGDKVNFAASLMIYPSREWWRYNVITSKKI